MNLSDINTVRSLLQKNGFSFKKSLGQNFLINPDVCPTMAKAACDKQTGVIEIGPGIGVLTAELSACAKRVVSVELDERLKRILTVTLADCKNVEIIYGDVMKIDLRKLISEKLSDCERVAVCANLPYYITSPIVMSLLESRLPVDNITVMVQKEVADRMQVGPGTKDYGALSLAVQFYAEPEEVCVVPPTCFVPQPKVSSSVIRLTCHEKPPVEITDEAFLFKVIRASFNQRRKTLANGLNNAPTIPVSREDIVATLEQLGYNPSVRGETLSLQEFAQLSETLKKKVK